MTLKKEIREMKKMAEHRRGASTTDESRQFNEGVAWGLKRALELIDKHIGQ